jgi:hypothetical protein
VLHGLMARSISVVRLLDIPGPDLYFCCYFAVFPRAKPDPRVGLFALYDSFSLAVVPGFLFLACRLDSGQSGLNHKLLVNGGNSVVTFLLHAQWHFGIMRSAFLVSSPFPLFWELVPGVADCPAMCWAFL